MKLQSVASIFLGAVVALAAVQAHAGSPNYGNVLHHAQEAKSFCVQALPITFSVPNTYQLLRAAIYNRFDYMRSLADKVAMLTPSGDAKRAEMLAAAKSLKNEAKVVEELIKKLDDLADNNDDNSTEHKAHDLRSLINKVQGRANILVNQLD